MKIKNILLSKNNSKKFAFIYKNNKITFSELSNKSSIMGQKIIDVEKKFNYCSQSIGILIQNSIEYTIAYFAIAYIDKVIVPINPKQSNKDIIDTIKLCELNILLTNNENFAKSCEIAKQLKVNITIFNIENNQKYNNSKEQAKRSIENDLTDVFIMLNTSGTTLKSKRVMLTNKNLLSNILSNLSSINLHKSDIGLIVLPMYFGYCNTSQLLTGIYLETTNIIYDGVFFAKKFFMYIEQYKITNTTLVPSMLEIINKYPYFYNYNYSSIKIICFGGGVSSEITKNSLIEKFPAIDFVETYGMTECSPRITALHTSEYFSKKGSVGKAIKDVKIQTIDEFGNKLLPGCTGEIIVSGDNVMKGYYKDSKLTDKTIQAEWLHTGDIGYIDNDEYLFLAGRKKNIIITSGINVFPEKIEVILKEFYAISDAYVYGEKNRLYGEIIIADIIVKSEFSKDKLNKYINYNLTEYERPKKINIVDKILKTYNGKNIRTNQRIRRDDNEY